MWSCTGGEYDGVRYDDIKHTLQNGDFLLFCGEGRFSRAVQCLTCSPYSHIGMIVRCEHFRQRGVPGYDRDDLYIWHCNSTTLKTPCIFNQKTKPGVQLNPLCKALSIYQGSIYLRQLQSDLLPRERKCDENFHKYMEVTSVNGYTDDLWELVTPVLPFDVLESIEYEKVPNFCSELVVHSERTLGYLYFEDPDNRYAPNHFSSSYLNHIGLTEKYPFPINLTFEQKIQRPSCDWFMRK